MPGRFSETEPLESWLKWMRESVEASPTSYTGGFPPGPKAGDPTLKIFNQAWEANPLKDIVPLNWAEIYRALSTLWERELSGPEHAMNSAAEFSLRLWGATNEIWQDSIARFWGLEKSEGKQRAEPPKGDKRFSAAEFETNPYYATLLQSYLLASEYLISEAEETGGGDPSEQRRLRLHLKQFVDAMAPVNFLLTNPAALKKATETGGASLAEGLRNLMSDMREGRLSMTDAEAFESGKNLAVTPGKVVYRNELIELIQYEPRTEKVHGTPIMFIPPWINKYYILDMRPDNSLVRYAVEQGFTVFMISWKTPPDAPMENVTFEDYIKKGPVAAAEAIREITGSEKINPVGYCVGDTLLAVTLSYLAQGSESERVLGPPTFMVALQDFEEVGDTAVFIDDKQVDFIEQQVLERGYLGSQQMANMFNLLRRPDLVLRRQQLPDGQKPPAFDLLYWNSDGTRMTRAAHSFYLRNTYLENNFVKPGKVKIEGDIYAAGAERDHIVPWRGAWKISALASGNVHFTLTSSGHIAGLGQVR